MIEKAILYQLINYLRDNDLEESLQSAYKTFHWNSACESS